MNSAGSTKHAGTVSLILGATLGASAGATVSWLLLSPDLTSAAGKVQEYGQIALAMLAGAGLALLVAIPVGWLIIARVLKNASGSIANVIGDMSAGANSALIGDNASAVRHLESAAREGAAWYAAASLRRWAAQTAIGIVVAFGSLVGSALLFRQIALLSEQNEKLQKQTELLDVQNKLISEQSGKIDLQTITSEAQRRSGALAELSELTKRIFSSTAHKDDQGNIIERRLDDLLISQLINFSNSVSEYYTVELSTRPSSTITDDWSNIIISRSERPRSPDRAQLLRSLLIAKVNVSQLKDISFEFADLRNARLSDASLRNLQLEKSDLSNVQFSNVDAYKTSFSGSTFGNAIFSGGNLNSSEFQKSMFDDLKIMSVYSANGADFSNSKINSLELNGVKGNYIDFSQTYINRFVASFSLIEDCKFSNAKINHIEISVGNLSGCKFDSLSTNQASFHGVNLQEASFVGADFNIITFADCDLTDVKIGIRTPGSRAEDYNPDEINMDRSKWHFSLDHEDSKYWVIRPKSP